MPRPRNRVLSKVLDRLESSIEGESVNVETVINVGIIEASQKSSGRSSLKPASMAAAWCSLARSSRSRLSASTRLSTVAIKADFRSTRSAET